MHCTRELLIAYRDGELPPERGAVVEAHLDQCAPCRLGLDALRDAQRQIEAAVHWLDASPEIVPEPRRALAALRAMESPPHNPIDDIRRRLAMKTASLRRPGVRWAAGGAIIVALVLAGLLFAPARQAAAQFLSIFRVQRFEAVSVGTQRTAQLHTLETLVNSGLLGEPTVLREAGAPRRVASEAEASQLAGFDLRTPLELPDPAALEEITVASGPHIRLEVPAATLASTLQAAGITDVTLPDLDSMTLDLDLPTVVSESYRFGTSEMEVIQAPSPSIVLPSGVAPAELGETFLQLAGLDPDQAREMAAQIDWTSTLVLPVPEGLARFRRLSVDGVQGLLLQGQDDGGHATTVVVWERDGMLYAVAGRRVIDAAILRAANSLQ